MKKVLFILLAAAFCLVMSACNKRCHCYGYDGSHHYFTPEEVDASNGSCSSMIYFADNRLYSICEWDY